jgi:hypothetical protein
LSPGTLSSTSIMDMYEGTIRKSFVVSSDQAHALHPNYAAKHEKNHQPQMNRGMVIKRNSNQRYATNGVTGMIIREIARRENLKPVQEFIVRQDCGCGSTIGPVISAATGIRAIDMGCPQLSMHSIRETMGVCDCTLDLFCVALVVFRVTASISGWFWPNRTIPFRFVLCDTDLLCCYCLPSMLSFPCRKSDQRIGSFQSFFQTLSGSG